MSMLDRNIVLALGICLMLAACGEEQSSSEPQSQQGLAAARRVEALSDVLAGDHRSDKNRARDAYRHPIETLSFFGIEPDMTVVEIWPGGGWYTEVIAPYLKRGGGKFIAAHWDPNDTAPYIASGLAKFHDKVADQKTYGPIIITALSDKTTTIAPDNSADLVVTFRNMHNWLNRGSHETILAQIYRALKPGGTFGVVDHRAPEDAPVDPKAQSGYVNEGFAIAIIEQAGFVFIESAPINDNPKDTGDHPFGVWTLPPTLRSAGRGEPPDENFDHGPYIDIGESDRFTLKFIKPRS